MAIKDDFQNILDRELFIDITKTGDHIADKDIAAEQCAQLALREELKYLRMVKNTLDADYVNALIANIEKQLKA